MPDSPGDAVAELRAVNARLRELLAERDAEPACCSGCAAALAGAPEVRVIRGQVTEVPEMRAEVTEHRMIARRCRCGTVTWGAST